jgi:hypothetical protein
MPDVPDRQARCTVAERFASPRSLSMTVVLLVALFAGTMYWFVKDQARSFRR